MTKEHKDIKTFTELLKEYNKKRQESLPLRMFDFFRYRISFIYKDVRFELKSAWLRVFRGYDNSAVWGHHYWHSEVTAKILRQLAKNKIGCPHEFFDKTKPDKECDAWTKVLIEMAEGFEAAIEMDNTYIENPDGSYNHEETKRKQDELKKKFDRGMELYHKHYLGLWD